jgi:poly(3-hydroxybutyrate) depolymerase
MALRRCVASGLMGLIFLFGCTGSLTRAEERPIGKNTDAGTHPFTMTVKGVQRSYLVHIPVSYGRAKEWHVVVMFHGGGGTAERT